MPTLIQGGDCLDAWARAVREIQLNHASVCDLVAEILDPTRIEEAWLGAHNPRNYLSTADNICDVINTIFPRRIMNKAQSRQARYASYLELHKRGMGRRANRGAWGTYFQRLIDFRGDGRTNQLERVLSKLQTWPNRSHTGLVFHLSSPEIDAPRTRGGPCWHYGEILWQKGDVLDFSVVYRNHDFFSKALGNYIALGQLLLFICSETGKTPGRLICHSMHAYFAAPRPAMARLVAGL